MTDHAQLSPVSVESMRTPVRNQNVFMIDDVPIQHYRFPMPICHCQKVDVSIYLEHVVGRSNVAGTNGLHRGNLGGGAWVTEPWQSIVGDGVADYAPKLGEVWNPTWCFYIHDIPRLAYFLLVLYPHTGSPKVGVPQIIQVIGPSEYWNPWFWGICIPILGNLHIETSTSFHIKVNVNIIYIISHDLPS